ncbi:QsdR family transcriptional regulator [Blastococcus sp. BMG 814]|uniref:QsdR family transcriptional regulator n=1 Tax=Blastococcus carthaginiensis TaxID=3050034 RepID=A0ABT9ICH1_9ACTN|nr:QsdR family transcriptional regulator [Blastococcus carthaginiensis]MDP5183270.1 QsdR family transcriptional regulator [Blastococcus carthaginiensis]
MDATASTPLRELLEGSTGRPTALEAFRLARRTFLAGGRVDMGALARELGVNRATLYRWVGSREQLLVEVLWSLARRTFERLIADPDTAVPGRSRVATVLDAWVHGVIANRGMQVFVENEGELALRLLTTRATDYQSRLLAQVRRLLAEDVEAGRVRSEMPLEDLTYVVVRILESYVYLTLITGEQPDPDRAGRVLHALLRPP